MKKIVVLLLAAAYLAGNAVAAANMAASSIICPSAWRVSQNSQARLHPEKRTNTIGVPVKHPSPCNE